MEKQNPQREKGGAEINKNHIFLGFLSISFEAINDKEEGSRARLVASLAPGPFSPSVARVQELSKGRITGTSKP